MCKVDWVSQNSVVEWTQNCLEMHWAWFEFVEQGILFDSNIRNRMSRPEVTISVRSKDPVGSAGATRQAEIPQGCKNAIIRWHIAQVITCVINDIYDQAESLI